MALPPTVEPVTVDEILRRAVAPAGRRITIRWLFCAKGRTASGLPQKF